MREHVRNLVSVLADKLPLEGPIYEFGSYIVEGQENLANLRPLFPDKEYIGVDMRKGPGVDIVLNMCDGIRAARRAWVLPHRTITTALMLDTIEHVEYPHDAIENLHFNMGRDSILVMVGPFYFKIHDYPSDYWRFTPAAFESLLKPFDTSICFQCGSPLFPHTIVGIGLNGAYVEKAASIQECLHEWRTINP